MPSPNPDLSIADISRLSFDREWLEPNSDWDGWDVVGSGEVANLPATLFDTGAARNGSSGQMSGVLSAINFSAVRPAYALPVIQPGSNAEKRRYKGPVKRAALLTNEAVRMCDEHITQNSRSPESDFLKLRMSVRGGMRVSEISDIPIVAMLDARGRIGDTIRIYARKTKTRREIAMHPEIRVCLERLLDRHPNAEHAAFSVGRNGMLKHQSAANLANWFGRLFKAAGLRNCSSHSGRRTFATEFARLLAAYGGSPRDLQDALGHKCLASTEAYLEPSDRIAQLIRNLGR